MNGIGMLKFLTAEEERVLTERGLAGDVEARNRVILNIYPWITRRARIYAGRVPHDDLVNHAISMCLEKFPLIDLKFKSRPMTYLTNVADRQMQEMVNTDGVIHTPINPDLNWHKPLDEKTMKRMSLAKRIASLSKIMCNKAGESAQIVDTIVDLKSVPPDEMASQREQEKGDRFFGHLQMLPNRRDRGVLYCRLIENMTLSKIACLMRVSKERVRQMELRAVQRLQRMIGAGRKVPRVSGDDVILPSFCKRLRAARLRRSEVCA